jgi:lantibiotic transport system permease protein
MSADPMLLRLLEAEWRKQRGSLAAWLVLGGACFTPAIILAVRLLRRAGVDELYARPDFWPKLWTSAWESMAIFLLPMGSVLVAALLSQVEWRGNAWKQVYAQPVRRGDVWLAKLAVAILLLAQLIVLFNVALWLSAMVPALLLPGVPWPRGDIPWSAVLRDDVRYFVACLPMLAIQHAISVKARNFLVPVGVGFLAWVAALAMLSTPFAKYLPHALPMVEYLGR